MLRAVVQTDDDKILFTDFWTLYPKRVARKLAERAWDKIDDTEYPAIMLALIGWRRVWRQRDEQFIPNPASWLNGERWTDELPTEFARSNHQSHRAFPLDAPDERSVMPEAVKSLLAKIRERR